MNQLNVTKRIKTIETEIESWKKFIIKFRKKWLKN
jgi:hypothetical protein